MKTRLLGVGLLITTAVVALLLVNQLRADGPNSAEMRARITEQIIADRGLAQPDETGPELDNPCTNGRVGTYLCNEIDLLARLPISKLGGGEGNDIWGWTDPDTGHEYAIMGLTHGTAFVDITNGASLIGILPSHTASSLWRDVKTYKNYAYIVSEAGGHGMQVFDLTQLRDVVTPPVTFSETAHYGEFSNAHNIVINEDGGNAFAVGTNTCFGGLHIISLKRPTAPEFVGCFDEDGYTHDAQCVMYTGPDSRYANREVCFNANEDTLTIVAMGRGGDPEMLSRTGYANFAYTHQVWVTEDQRYLLLDDELDEAQNGTNTRTFIWDIGNLHQPRLIGTYTAETEAIDHNLYIKGDLVYQANYRAGLRILDASNIAAGELTEVGYFDIYPDDDDPNFNGAWSVYPYFESGKIVVSGIEQGLFVLARSGDRPPPVETFSTYLPLLQRE